MNDEREYKRRSAILATLSFDPVATVRTLREELEIVHGIAASADLIRADLDWLAEMRLVRVAGGGIEQAMGRIIAAGLMRCEALLEKIAESEDVAGAIQASASLGDTVAKLKAAGKGMMPEADQLAIENGAIKAFADLMIKRHPKTADQVLATVEAWAGGQR